MIEFSNGHQLKFANGSGALAFNGKGWWWEQPLRWFGLLDPKAFTVVAKTVTRHPRKGNLSLWHPWTCVSTIRKGVRRGATNAVGLTNPGIEAWIKDDYPVAKQKGYALSASIWPESIEEAAEMGKLMAALHLCYIEVNVSCPNTKHEQDTEKVWRICDAVSANCEIPLVLKLAEKQVIPEIVEPASEFVEAFHAINTIPWDEVFPGEKSPIEGYSHKLKGGVSGDFIRTRAMEAVRKLKGMTDVPIIGGGGISSLEDVQNFEIIGASAFSIGTLFMTRPWKPNEIVRQYHNDSE